MTVFKKYLKIANTYTLMILAYTAIFLGLAIFYGELIILLLLTIKVWMLKSLL